MCFLIAALKTLPAYQSYTVLHIAFTVKRGGDRVAMETDIGSHDLSKIPSGTSPEHSRLSLKVSG